MVTRVTVTVFSIREQDNLFYPNTSHTSSEMSLYKEFEAREVLHEHLTYTSPTGNMTPHVRPSIIAQRQNDFYVRCR